MATTHAISTSRYLLNSASVLSAGRELQNMLGEDPDTLEFAVTQLEEAAKGQETGATKYRAFMFAELKRSKGTQTERRERISEDVFATVLMDMQIANVLMAAGHAVGEANGNPEPQFLDEALNDLNETRPVIARGLSSPLGKEMGLNRFNFSQPPAKAKARRSAKSESATQTFKRVSDDTLDQIVSGAHEVSLSVLAALKKLSPERILEALNQLGGPMQTITGLIRRLISQGIQKMKQAIDDLVRLISNDAITTIKDKIKEIWSDREKGIVDSLLAKIIGVEATRASITTILSLEGIDKDTATQGSNDLSQLLIPYKGNIEMAKKSVKAISFFSGVLVLTPFAGQKIALFAASSYLIILAAVVLVAMDYADSGGILRRVRGVGEIANDLRPIKKAPKLIPQS
jgi:hypothetical protein